MAHVAEYDPYTSVIFDGCDKVVCDEPRAVVLFPSSFSVKNAMESSISGETRESAAQSLTHFPRSSIPANPLFRDEAACDEPRVLLFPLSFAAMDSSDSSLPRKFAMSPAAQPLSHAPRPSITMEPSSNEKIEELKRRLDQIKRRRARRREQTNDLQKRVAVEEEPELRVVSPSPSAAEAPQHESPTVWKIAPELKSSRAVNDTRHKSLSSQTEGETIDTMLVSTNVPHSLHPRRLFCSTYRTKETAPKHKQSNHPYKSEVRSPRPPQDGEVTSKVLDSLVCIRPNEEDPLDLVFCGDGRRNENHPPRNGNQRFDPYEGQWSCIDENTEEQHEDSSGRWDVVPSKRCLPLRSPAWYERPEAIATDENNARVMEVIFYSNKAGGLQRLNVE